MSPTLDVETLRSSEAHRYTRRNILRSEFMYGHGFQSPGGVEAVEAFCARLDLQAGMRALEIGSGLGGSSFYLASRHHLDVTGLDVSDAMIEISEERRRRGGIQGVRFVRGDIRTAELAERWFDLVWTRDCVLYLPQKDLVWRQAARCLRANGQLFVSDFARGDGQRSAAFEAYVEGCGYHLDTLDDYAHRLADEGFTIAQREDVTVAFVAGLEHEKAQLARRSDAFLRDFTRDDYDYLMERWDQKLAFCRAGHLRWGLFVAQRR